MHFIVIIFEELEVELLSSEAKLFDNSIGLLNISEIVSILFLAMQSHKDCLLSSLYPV